MSDIATEKARKDAQEMRGYMAGLDHDNLLEVALQAYENGQRLRYELDEIMGVVR